MSKTIFITGAGTGLGKGTAIVLAEKGHRVIAAVEIISQITSLREAASEAGVELEVIKLDIKSKRDQQLIAEYDYDVFVANAAIGEGGPIAEIPVDRVRDVYETNVFSTLENAQIAAKKFVDKKQGKIIFLSSIVGIVGMPYLGAYVSSKHAIEAIAKTMKAELEEFGVQVATINPGPFETGFNDRMFEEKHKWYDEDKNFTPRESIAETEQILDQQYDPQDMIDKMVEVIEADHHAFRTAYPQEAEDMMKEEEKKNWEEKV
ncbi:short-chain dehydrogenase/reductase [Halobacillus andaensis]|uniref:Short-chain dehydrogenase/reductase n=1 Tax=Halobacillus andaensis TaxID=1176239 RepID=A0A917B349_HALAA|nr:SDR family oxidoreductase [Halobacillus andaensis]MBP2004617.1 short-subunit dehydrogenase [Halobacillus andaensis]GGF20276.1 short-chain dehydrogenase/reductase [Halobacillus andaensis]